MSILHSELKEDRDEILAACAASTKVACKVFYPERFRLPFSPMHDQVFDALDDDSINMLVIKAFRGFGKSSIMQLGYPTKRAVFMDDHFIVPASSTYRQSMIQSENLKRELQRNRRLHDFGFKNLQSEVWSRDMWVINTADGHGCMVLPVSYGQEVRGIIYKNSRPTLYLVDDWETVEAVMNEEQRQKRKERFYADIMGSIDRSRKDWRIIVIGTPLHEDSLLMNLAEDPHWHSVHIELCDAEFISAWPEQQSSDEVYQMFLRYQRQGMEDAFYREYRCLCQSPDKAPFKAHMFKYFLNDQLANRFLEYFVLVDPAKSVTENSCDTAIVCVGIDIMEGEVYIVDMECSRLHVNEQIDAALSMCQRWKARTIGVEITGSGEYIEWTWRSAILERGLGYEFVPLKATKGPSQYIPENSSKHGKDARIGAALVPLYHGGKIYHPKLHPLTKKLEEQLIHYPRAKRKDLIDALAYVAGMMHKGERYFANQTVVRQARQGNYLPGGLDYRAEEASLRKLIGKDMPEIPNWRV